MSILSDDLHKALRTAWSEASLDNQFTTYWDDGQEEEHSPYNDGEPSPGCPFPYCVYNVGATDLIGRSTGSGAGDVGKNRQQRDYPVTFMIHAQTANNKSAKQIASEIAETIMATFGGHNTTAPKTLSLENGAAIGAAQLISEYGIRTGDSEYMWTINYNFRTDVPVMV